MVSEFLVPLTKQTLCNLRDAVDLAFIDAPDLSLDDRVLKLRLDRVLELAEEAQSYFELKSLFDAFSCPIAHYGDIRGYYVGLGNGEQMPIGNIKA